MMRLLLTAATLGVMLFSGSVSAQAASRPSAAQPGAGCGNPSSAVNQYCEDIPSASGGSTPPAAGTPGPVLGATLPRSAVRAFGHLPARTQKRARKLLSLPAAGTSVPVTAAIGVHKSAWSLPTGVILALLAIAVGAVAVAAARRRRRTE